MKHQSIGSYLLGRTIGEGTFGRVRVGVQVNTDETVAVKVLDKAKLVDYGDIQRLARELAILKMVGHPHVVQLYEVIETPGQMFLVLEHCSKGELFDHIVERGQFPEVEAARFFRQILAGVEHLHGLGIAHRDLKPENLLLDFGMNIKIADFGLSNTFRPNEVMQTACGSPCYAPPEMLQCDTYEPMGCDIWSCGVILFALVCGYLPFEHDNQSCLYRMILAADFQLPKHTSSGFNDLVKKILVVDPTKRLTLEQVVAHRWCRDVPMPTPMQVTEGPAYEIPLDGEVLDHMEAMSIPRDYAERCLRMGKHNNATTTYHLLVGKKHREGSLAGGQSTSAATTATAAAAAAAASSSNSSNNNNNNDSNSGSKSSTESPEAAEAAVWRHFDEVVGRAGGLETLGDGEEVDGPTLEQQLEQQLELQQQQQQPVRERSLPSSSTDVPIPVAVVAPFLSPPAASCGQGQDQGPGQVMSTSVEMSVAAAAVPAAGAASAASAARWEDQEMTPMDTEAEDQDMTPADKLQTAAAATGPNGTSMDMDDEQDGPAALRPPVPTYLCWLNAPVPPPFPCDVEDQLTFPPDCYPPPSADFQLEGASTQIPPHLRDLPYVPTAEQLAQSQALTAAQPSAGAAASEQQHQPLQRSLFAGLRPLALLESNSSPPTPTGGSAPTGVPPAPAPDAATPTSPAGNTTAVQSTTSPSAGAIGEHKLLEGLLSSPPGSPPGEAPVLYSILSRSLRGEDRLLARARARADTGLSSPSSESPPSTKSQNPHRTRSPRHRKSPMQSPQRQQQRSPCMPRGRSTSPSSTSPPIAARAPAPVAAATCESSNSSNEIGASAMRTPAVAQTLPQFFVEPPSEEVQLEEPQQAPEETTAGEPQQHLQQQEQEQEQEQEEHEPEPPQQTQTAVGDEVASAAPAECAAPSASDELAVATEEPSVELVAGAPHPPEADQARAEAASAAPARPEPTSPAAEEAAEAAVAGAPLPPTQELNSVTAPGGPASARCAGSSSKQAMGSLSASSAPSSARVTALPPISNAAAAAAPGAEPPAASVHAAPSAAAAEATAAAVVAAAPAAAVAPTPPPILIGSMKSSLSMDKIMEELKRKLSRFGVSFCKAKRSSLRCKKLGARFDVEVIPVVPLSGRCCQRLVRVLKAEGQDRVCQNLWRRLAGRLDI